MKIGVIGGGVVGSAIARSYTGWAEEVRVYDVKSHLKTHDWDSTVLCDVVFLCIPENNLDEIFTDWAWGTERRKTVNLVLKSTVPVGTTRRLAKQYGLTNLVHSPEFLTARTAAFDAMNPRVNIIGHPNGVPCVGNPPSVDVVWDLYNARFSHVPTVRMSSNESELVKLSMNGFFAVKVAYWNEVKRLCDKLQLDYETIRDGVLADGRIQPLHTQVPGPDGKHGFGGACLEKDLAMLIECLQHNN